MWYTNWTAIRSNITFTKFMISYIFKLFFISPCCSYFIYNQMFVYTYVCIWVYTYTCKLYRHNTKVSKELIFIKVQCLTVRFIQHSVLVFYFTSTLYFIHMIPSLIFIQSKLKLKFPISHPIIQRKTKKIGTKCNNVGVTQSLLTDMWLMNRAWPVIRE